MSRGRPGLATALDAAMGAWVVAGASVLLALSSGCGGAGARQETPVTIGRGSAGTRGLQSWVFVVDDTDDQAGRVLASVMDPPAHGDEAFAMAMRANGLRAVKVPIDGLDAFIAGLSETGQRREERLGETFSWSPVMAGEVFPTANLGTDAGVTDLPTGAVLLYARAWIVRASGSTPGDGALALRLELVPAFDGVGGERVWFRRMLAETELGRDEAVVLIAAPPLTDWWSQPPPDPERQRAIRSVDTDALRRAMGIGLGDEPAGPRADPEPGAAVGSGRGSGGSGGSGSGGAMGPAGSTGASPVGPAGPSLPRLASMGELLMGGRSTGVTTGRSATVVILVPRLEGRVRAGGG